MNSFIIHGYYCTAKAGTPVSEDGSTGSSYTANNYHFSRQASLTRQAYLITPLNSSHSKAGVPLPD